MRNTNVVQGISNHVFIARSLTKFQSPLEILEGLSLISLLSVDRADIVQSETNNRFVADFLGHLQGSKKVLKGLRIVSQQAFHQADVIQSAGRQCSVTHSDVQ